MRRFICLCLVFLAAPAVGQDTGRYAVSLQTDLVKTDFANFVGKAQSALEIQYFVSEKVSASTGVEVWTAEEVSFVIGGRWYPSRDAFIRVRGLVGENDISIGGGWTMPISDRFRFEAMTDFYFKIDFTIRAGITVMIN